MMTTEAVAEAWRRAVALEHGYGHRLPRPVGSRSSAVAIVVAAAVDESAGEQVLLVRRAEDGGRHSGQMAFPGGKVETGENADEAARRECREEIGWSPEPAQRLGDLPELDTFTGFRIQPVVYRVERGPAIAGLAPEPREVARVIWVPWARLASGELYRRERYLGFPIDVFHWEGERIWGATAAMLQNLRERLAKVETLR